MKYVKRKKMKRNYYRLKNLNQRRGIRRNERIKYNSKKRETEQGICS